MKITLELPESLCETPLSHQIESVERTLIRTMNPEDAQELIAVKNALEFLHALKDAAREVQDASLAA